MMKSKGYKGRFCQIIICNGWNNRAIKNCQNFGIDQRYAFPELNFRELSELSNGGNLIVYGYQPVMITANCTAVDDGGLSWKDSMLYITDRLGNKFPVKITVNTVII